MAMRPSQDPDAAATSLINSAFGAAYAKVYLVAKYLSQVVHVADNMDAVNTVADGVPDLEAALALKATIAAPVFTSKIQILPSAGLTAAGSSSSNPLQLTNSFNEVTTVVEGTGVRLPVAGTGSVVGLRVTVWNEGDNPLSVYPMTGGQIDSLGADTADIIAPGTNKVYVATTSSQYRIESMGTRPFQISAVNSSIAVTATSQAILLQGTGSTVMLQNVGSSECFVAAGSSEVVAVAAATPAVTDATDGSMSIPPGAVVVCSLPADSTYLAAVCATGGTTTLRVSRGEGS